MNNCAIGGCNQRGHRSCPLCGYWTPSRSSRYYNCARYYRHRITCDQLSCDGCAHYEESVAEGRPNLTGVDWQDDEERRRYLRDYMRRKRREAKVRRDRTRD